MIAITIELLISWILLKFVAHEKLSVLGLIPGKRMCYFLLAGFLLPVCYLAILYFTISRVVGNPYLLNPHYTLRQFMYSSFFVLKGVIYEELLFRGVLLFLVFRTWGLRAGLIVSAIAFGIYHWFVYGILGQPAQMLIVFISTGTMGMLFALSFYRGKTLWLPFAIHFGYNFTSMILFSVEKQIGPQLLTKSFQVDPIRPEGFLPLLLIVLYYAGFPLLCFLFLLTVKGNRVTGK